MNDLLIKFFYLFYFLLGFFLATIIFKILEFKNKPNKSSADDPSDWWKKGKDPFNYDE